MRGANGLAEMLQPEFGGRDVTFFVEGLSLDAGQEAVVRSLIDDYAAEFARGVTPVNDTVRDLGPRMFRSIMTDDARGRYAEAMEEVRAELRRLEQEGTVDQEAQRAVMREHMARVAEEVREARRASGDEAESQRLMGEMVAVLERWRTERARQRESLIAGLKAQLRPDQLEKWPSVERALEREKTLPRGMLSGESTDLLRIVERLDLDEAARAAVAPALETYEMRLANALKARNDHLALTEPKLMRAIQALDVAEAMRIIERQVQHRVHLRDVNEEGRAAIAAALPEPAATQFREEALRDAYERVFRPMRADEVFEYVRGLELSPEALEAVGAIEAAYRQELAAANQKLIELMKKSEPKELLNDAERFAGFLGGGGFPGGPFDGGQEDPVREAFRQRRDMGEKHIERLAALLTPAQAESMPQRERRSFGGGFENLPPGLRERILERADANRNGRIDPDEEAEARRAFGERARGGRGPDA